MSLNFDMQDSTKVLLDQCITYLSKTKNCIVGQQDSEFQVAL